MPRKKKEVVPPHQYATYIDKFLDKGHQVVVAVWNEQQRVPAGVYIKSALQRFPHGDAVCEVNDDPSLQTGQIRNGRHVIRYHFNGNSSGGGGG